VAFSVLESLTIRYLFFPGLVKRAFDLAEDMGQPTVYDTIYAAVAEAVQCELWTADAAFHRAASSRLPFIRLLAETA
jgi:predicted nucleic acid-binding protein